MEKAILNSYIIEDGFLIYLIVIDKLFFPIYYRIYIGYSGCSSVVERNLAKVDVARSNRVTRY